MFFIFDVARVQEFVDHFQQLRVSICRAPRLVFDTAERAVERHQVYVLAACLLGVAAR